MRISLVIPTCNAEAYMDSLLSVLETQSKPVDEIIVVDSASDDSTVEIAKKRKNVKIMEIKRSEFNHGTTRHKAFLESGGDIVCFLTQDALPKNEFYIENLIKPFDENPKIACVWGRQVAEKNASMVERLSREYNYKNESFVRSKSDIEIYGIKTIFTSNCCSAYRRTAYMQVDGFRENIVSEDMEIAYRFLIAGFEIAYQSEAMVFHSHNYSLLQNFRRHFDIAVFLKDHPCCDLDTMNEGKRFAGFAFKKLLKQARFLTMLHLIAQCIAKLAGNIMGRHYRIFPKCVVKRMSAQKNWWEEG